MSLQAVASTGAAHFVEAEVIEYGKYAISPDGSVGEYAEHQTLGSTFAEGKGEDLKRLCRPATISHSLLDNEPLAQANASGIVIQPVSSDGVLWSVACCARLMNEVIRNRDYRRARYLVSTDPVSPLAVFTAFESEPVQALSEQQACALERKRIRSVDPGNQDTSSQFLFPALQYTISGIPILLSGPIEPRQFFELAHGLWRMLPEGLRILFSAGYGVGASLTDRLHVAWGRSYSPNCAHFHVASQEWVPPQRGNLADRVKPGRLYRERLFPGDFTQPHRVRLATINDLLQDDLTRHPPGVLGLNTAWLQTVFSAAGYHAHEDTVLERLMEDLKRGSAEQPYTPLIELQASKHIALKRVLESLEDTSQAAKASMVLVRWHKEDPAAWERAFQSISHPGPNTLLFRHALIGSPVDLLDGLTREGVTHQPVFIQELVEQQVVTAFTRGDDAVLARHRSLLDQPEPPEPYIAILRSHGWKLALQFGNRYPGDALQFTQRIAFLAPSRELAFIKRMLQGEPPERCDELLKSFGGDFARRIEDFVSTRWEGRSVLSDDQLNQLAGWAAQFPSIRSGILEAYRRSLRNETAAEFPRDRLRDLGQELHSGSVPPCARKPSADAIMANLSAFLDLHDPVVCRSIAGLLPSRTAILLGLRRAPVRKAAEGRLPDLQPEGLEKLLDFWCRDNHKKGLKGVAVDLLRMTQSLPGQRNPPATPMWLWHRLLREEEESFVYGAGSEPDWITIQKVARLNEAQPRKIFSNRSRKALAETWPRCAFGWQIALWLQLLPEFELAPTPRHLELLWPWRSKLAGFLKRPPHPLYRLLTRGFQEIPYIEGEPLCEAALSSDVLWGLVKGAPPGRQCKELIYTLRFLCPTGADDVEAQLLMASEFLQSNRSEASARRVVGFVWNCVAGSVKEKPIYSVILRAMKGNLVSVAVASSPEIAHQRPQLERVSPGTYQEKRCWKLSNRVFDLLKLASNCVTDYEWELMVGEYQHPYKEAEHRW